MDLLEKKNNNLLQRLRELRALHCCSHIDQQINLWLENQVNPGQVKQHAGRASASQATQSRSQLVDQQPQIRQIKHELQDQPTPQLQKQEQQPQQELQPHHQQPEPQPQPQQQPQTSSSRDKTITDPRAIGCFLSNLRQLESFDSDATESMSSNDSYDELEGFSHEEIPPKRNNIHPLNKTPNSTSHGQHHRASTSSLHSNSYQSLHQRRASQMQNLPNVVDSTNSAYNIAIGANPHMSDLKKKAIWKWAKERGRLASKWTWLQAQIGDLEFRVRGQNDSLMHARAYKVPPLPQNIPENTCSRAVPLNKDFRKRRLIKSSQILADSNKRSVKFSHVPCICSSLPQIVAPCLSCNGRYNYLRQFDGENEPQFERVSMIDPGCHPVLSFPEDVTLGSQISYLLKQETINRKPIKGRPGRKKGSTAANLAANAAANEKNAKHAGRKGKYHTGMGGRAQGIQPGLKNPSQTMIASNKLKRKYRKHSNNSNNYDSSWYGSNNHTTKRNKRIRSASSMNESSLCSESSNPYRPNHFSNNNNNARNVSRRRRSEQSAYDIDNIVIPFSVAATTRVEILEYKEIMTPSWRVWENGTCQTENNVEEDVEDISDEAYIQRHTKGEHEEKKRFSLKPPPKSESTTVP